MAGNGQKKRLALDTNLLLDLARDLDFAHDFRTSFQSAGYSLSAGPTVFRELGLASLYGREPEKSQAITTGAEGPDELFPAQNLTGGGVCGLASPREGTRPTG